MNPHEIETLDTATEAAGDPATRIARIEQFLQQTFAPLACQVLDESALHAGHAGARSGGGHYRIRLVSTLFEGKNRVARQRLVYDCLKQMMQREIHAIAMITLTPTEAAAEHPAGA